MHTLKNLGLQLTYFLYKHRNREFEWGKWDCRIFATEWVYQVTGFKFSMEAEYINEYEAVRLAKKGWRIDSVVDAVALSNDWDTISRCETGCLVVKADSIFGAALGIGVFGERGAFLSPDKGVVLASLENSTFYRLKCHQQSQQQVPS